jgi:hypothetical protein
MQQVPGTHAALAARDERRHPQLEIHFVARDEALKLLVGEDHALLPNLPPGRGSHSGDGVGIDELRPPGGIEEAEGHRANVPEGLVAVGPHALRPGAARSSRLPALDEQRLQQRMDVRRPTVPERQMSNAREDVALEVAALVGRHDDALRLALAKPLLRIVLDRLRLRGELLEGLRVG